jgi:hypothetical protein
MLEVTDLQVAYGRITALRGVKRVMAITPLNAYS